ncbi:hypothetical protein CMUS01_03154 [Colletotrichum musicola]|uniref:HNH nuclease domain-containing protein n=1 Tax=Colletotrichum musicola TaxID=2175873 RepID=A0A8H6NTW2_9PEZI|nr:hypothetical protein CMUS01_03154 [Colletotrichum musicola]
MGVITSREGRSLGYLGDIERKMALLQEIHKHSQPRLERFPELGKASCCSMLLTLDVTALKWILDDLHGPGTKPTVTLKYLRESSIALPKLLSLFVKGHTSDSPVPRTKECRNETETEQVKKRDNQKCILTGTISTEVCHIFPSADSRFTQHIFLYLRSILNYIDTGVELLDLLEELKATTPITDSRRNMICLSPVTPYAVEIGTLHPRPHGPALEGMLADLPLDTDPRTRFKDPLDGIDAYDIKDGQVITVRADCQDDLPDYDILDLQAKLTTAWALTAGVDPREYD